MGVDYAGSNAGGAIARFGELIRDATRPLRRRLRGQKASSRPINASERAAVLQAIVAGLGRLSTQLDPARPKSIAERFGATAESEALSVLLTRHGSDKALGGNYPLAYAALLSARRHEHLRVLEIGLGTNNVDVPSNMGANGRPGASLRAWRDWLPNAEIFGADVDSRVLFTEDRIATHWVDQTKTDSLAALKRFGPFDVVIDDGLHRLDANINTLTFALGSLKPGGIVVIEDIGRPDAPVWRAIARLLAPDYSAEYLTDAHHGILVVRQA